LTKLPINETVKSELYYPGGRMRFALSETA
jgi:hypothetical protein